MYQKARERVYTVQELPAMSGMRLCRPGRTYEAHGLYSERDTQSEGESARSGRGVHRRWVHNLAEEQYVDNTYSAMAHTLLIKLSTSRRHWL